MSVSFLELVNRQHPIVREPAPAELCCALPGWPNILLRREAAWALQNLLAQLACGDAIVPVSGYRSGAEQRAIWEDTIRESGLAFAQKFVAYPGCSEHQTGLAIDLAENRPPIDFICPAFPYSGVCQRFRDLAPRYGFIQRYPAGKEAVTGIGHEPWHFRYVGAAAREIARRGLVLEEYCAKEEVG